MLLKELLNLVTKDVILEGSRLYKKSTFNSPKNSGAVKMSIDELIDILRSDNDKHKYCNRNTLYEIDELRKMVAEKKSKSDINWQVGWVNKLVARALEPQVFNVIYDATGGEPFPENFQNTWIFDMDAEEFLPLINDTALKVLSDRLDTPVGDIKSGKYALTMIKVVSNKNFTKEEAAKYFNNRVKNINSFFDAEYT